MKVTLIHQFILIIWSEYIDPNDLNSLIAKANKQENLKEIHRVSELVRRITSECFIVPKDAFKLKIGNYLHKNEDFKLTLPQHEFNQKKESDETQNYKSLFCLFNKPSNEVINKYLALKESKEFREQFEIEYFCNLKNNSYLGKGI